MEVTTYVIRLTFISSKIYILFLSQFTLVSFEGDTEKFPILVIHNLRFSSQSLPQFMAFIDYPRGCKHSRDCCRVHNYNVPRSMSNGCCYLLPLRNFDSHVDGNYWCRKFFLKCARIVNSIKYGLRILSPTVVSYGLYRRMAHPSS